MRSIYLVIPFFFIIASCNKNRDNIIDITGNVKNAINNQSAAGVQVKLEVKDLGGNSFSNSFKLRQQLRIYTENMNSHLRIEMQLNIV